MITILMLAVGFYAGQTLIPNEVAAYPYAYVTNKGSNNVSVIDIDVNQEIATITVRSAPRGVAITPDSRYAYVTNSGSANVSVIDTTTNQERFSITVGSDPYGVVVTPDGRYAYVTNEGSNNVSVIDISANSVISTVTITGSKPRGIAITPDGKYAYVANNGSKNVSVIATEMRKEISTIPLEGEDPILPMGVAITPDGNYVYVTNWANIGVSISVIDTNTKKVVGTITLDALSCEVVITPDGKYAYVANATSNISVIDTITKKKIKNIYLSGALWGIAITPDGRYAYVTNSDSNTVSVIDTTTNQVVGSPISVRSRPHGIAITPTLLPTLANTQIINGTDTGTLNAIDTPGDVILSYISEGVPGTITCNQVTTTVEQVYGLSHLPQPADKSGTYNTKIYYTYWLRNTGNGTDTIGLTTSNS